MSAGDPSTGDCAGDRVLFRAKSRARIDRVKAVKEIVLVTRDMFWATGLCSRATITGCIAEIQTTAPLA
jgi:hypothetical protein